MEIIVEARKYVATIAQTAVNKCSQVPKRGLQIQEIYDTSVHDLLVVLKKLEFLLPEKRLFFLQILLTKADKYLVKQSLLSIFLH